MLKAIVLKIRYLLSVLCEFIGGLILGFTFLCAVPTIILTMIIGGGALGGGYVDGDRYFVSFRGDTTEVSELAYNISFNLEASVIVSGWIGMIFLILHHFLKLPENSENSS